MAFLNEKDYVAQAEKVILELKKKKKENKKYEVISTSQLRNILARISSIYIEVLQGRDDILSEEVQGQIQYLKLTMVYDSGRRETNVKDFVLKANLLEYIDEIKDSKEKFLLFEKYMEALVAYHKYHGGE